MILQITSQLTPSVMDSSRRSIVYKLRIQGFKWCQITKIAGCTQSAAKQLFSAAEKIVRDESWLVGLSYQTASNLLHHGIPSREKLIEALGAKFLKLSRRTRREVYWWLGMELPKPIHTPRICPHCGMDIHKKPKENEPS
jgi:hypothetical protein